MTVLVFASITSTNEALHGAQKSHSPTPAMPNHLALPSTPHANLARRFCLRVNHEYRRRIEGCAKECLAYSRDADRIFLSLDVALKKPSPILETASVSTLITRTAGALNGAQSSSPSTAVSPDH